MRGIRACFPTFLYQQPLGAASGTRGLLRELLKESYQIAEADLAGKRWSARHYPGGYTSYGSLAQMHELSSTFRKLRARLDRHVRRYAQYLEWDLSQDQRLEMTQCWVNIMPRGSTHSGHLHPLSSVSGTLYLQTPSGGGALKFEDPRLAMKMATPPRREPTREENCSFLSLKPRAGHLVLFESWLRHEVPPNLSSQDRVSVSFNYNWFH